MKNKLKYIAVVCLFIPAMTGCDDNITIFEVPGNVSAPADIDVNSINSESLPGQIYLTWQVPQGDFAYIQIKYYDPLRKKDVYKIASKGTTEMLIENTRARYGDYEFSFQTFNALHQGGVIETVKAISGAAPITETITRKKVELTENQLSTNNQEPTEGPIRNLIDGNASTFFHTRWSGTQMDMPQYIQVNLSEPLQTFQFYYQNRNGSQVGPDILEVQISNNGTDWDTISTINDGLPSGARAEYYSETYRLDRNFRFFRYNVLHTYGGARYFNLAEFALFDVTINIYNPETDEED